uniref:Uncharacterized protein n=1 Tax=Zea mays TaxID=4577 RepID=A0A804QG75_MAIZE
MKIPPCCFDFEGRPPGLHLHVVDHADLDEADVGDVQRHRRPPAVLPEEGVGVVDGERLEEIGVLPRLHVRVADDVGRAGLLGLQEVGQLVPHLRLDPLLLVDLEPHPPPPPADGAGGLLLVDGLQAPERLRLAAPGQGRAFRVLGGGHHHQPGPRRAGGVHDRHPALRRRLVAPPRPRRGRLLGLHLDEPGDAHHQVVLEVLVVLLHVLVPVPDDAPVHAVLPGADPPDEVPLVHGHVRHRHGLDAHEDQHLVERRQVGDEVGEDGRHARHQLRVDEADPGHAHDAQARAQVQDPSHGHLVLEVEQVLPPRAVVPHVHDEHEHGG